MSNFDKNTFLNVLSDMDFNIEMFEKEIEKMRFELEKGSDYCNPNHLNDFLQYAEGYKSAVSYLRYYFEI